jgi:pimeloyl-ACP methyl ester carboxylesterase
MPQPATCDLTRADGTVLRYCLYGPRDGYPVISHSGSPSSRWKRPVLIEAMRRSNLSLLVYDRPGYGGSTRRAGRTVADAVDDVQALRSRLAGAAADIMAGIDAGAPEMPGEPGPPAVDDADAMARLRATFIDAMDGWADDSIAFGQPWGFDLAAITVPVGIWRGTGDVSVSAEHTDYLLSHIPTARGQVYVGGHLPDAEVYDEIYAWL